MNTEESGSPKETLGRDSALLDLLTLQGDWLQNGNALMTLPLFPASYSRVASGILRRRRCPSQPLFSLH